MTHPETTPATPDVIADQSAVTDRMSARRYGVRPATPEGDAISRGATPAAKWREEGQLDPHGNRYDCERATLTLGDLTDDEIADAVFMFGDTPPPMSEVMAGRAKMPIAYLTAAKDRIRWLSRKLVEATALRSLPPQDGERELAAYAGAMREVAASEGAKAKRYRFQRNEWKDTAQMAEAALAEARVLLRSASDLFSVEVDALKSGISVNGEVKADPEDAATVEAIAEFEAWIADAADFVNGAAAPTAQPVAQEPVADMPAEFWVKQTKGYRDSMLSITAWDDPLPAGKVQARYIRADLAHPATPAPVEAGLRRDARDLRRLWALLRGEDPDDLEDGPRCRDCADEDGRCPSTGRLCDPQAAAEEAITALRAQSAPVGGEGGDL